MENNQQESFLQFHLDYDGGNALKEAVRWSRFCAIIYYILMGLFLLFILLAIVFGSEIVTQLNNVLPMAGGFAGVGAAIIIVICIICLGVGIVLAYLLYRFSSLTRKGIEHQEQAVFSEGMKCLKNYFLIYGIVTAIMLLFNFLSLSRLF